MIYVHVAVKDLPKPLTSADNLAPFTLMYGGDQYEIAGDYKLVQSLMIELHALPDELPEVIPSEARTRVRVSNEQIGIILLQELDTERLKPRAYQDAVAVLKELADLQQKLPLTPFGAVDGEPLLAGSGD